MKIRWTEPARDDLQALRRYISIDSASSAQQFCARLVNAVEGLSQHPRRGPLVTEGGKALGEVRQLLFRDYRILYRVDVDTVFILAVVHGSRDLRPLTRPPRQ